MNKLQEYKKLQREVFKQFFDNEIVPHLKDTDVVYYGMGTHGVDNNEEYNYFPSYLGDKVYNFLENNLPFYNREICEVYILLEIIDSPTNKLEMDKNSSECPKILVSKYKDTFM